MNREQFCRSEALYKEEGLRRLEESRVAVFGLGGVGGYVVEALARSGIGSLDLIDSDVVEISNLNRQLAAVYDTVGRPKTEVMEARVHSILPECRVKSHSCFYLPDTAQLFDFSQYDYVVDAVDTVTAKVELILRAKQCGVPVISCMGAGNRLDPSALRTADIYETSVCPLARVMRRELKRRGVKSCQVVFSTEAPVKTGGRIPGSSAFVPAAAGILMASRVVNEIAFAAPSGQGSGLTEGKT